MDGLGAFGSPGGYYQEGVFAEEGEGEHEDEDDETAGLGLGLELGLGLGEAEEEEEEEEEETSRETFEVVVKMVSASLGSSPPPAPVHAVLSLGRQELRTGPSLPSTNPRDEGTENEEGVVAWGEDEEGQRLHWDGFAVLQLQLVSVSPAEEQGQGQVLGEAFVEIGSLGLAPGTGQEESISLSPHGVARFLVTLC